MYTQDVNAQIMVVWVCLLSMLDLIFVIYVNRIKHAMYINPDKYIGRIINNIKGHNHLKINNQ